MRLIKKALAVMLTAAMVLTSFSYDTVEAATGTKPSDGTTSNQPYISNTTGGSQYFRIPAMVTLDNGTIVTAADARWNGTGDGGGNDTVVSYSTDGGSTWNYTFANYLGDNGNSYNGASTCFIDPSLATDGSTVYMLVDLWPAGYALNSANKTPVAGANGFDSNGRLRLSSDNRSSYGYYLSGNTIYSTSGTAVSGLTVDAKYNVTGTYNGTTYNTNLFCSDSPFVVYPTNYLWLTKSTDGGATWGDPTLINVKKASEQSCLVGPGTGIVTSTGRIIYTVYDYTSGSEVTSVIYSDDKGATWTRSANMNSASSEGTLTEVKVGSTNYLYMFTRHGGYYISTDNGATWSSKKSVSGISYWESCQLNVMTYSKTIDGKPAILLSVPGSTSGRTDGKIFVGLIQDDGSINWKYTYSVNSGTYQYSAIAELSDGSIGLLYENGTASITYTNLAISTIASGATIGESTVTYTASADKTTLTVGDTTTLKVTASDNSTPTVTWSSSDSNVVSVSGTTATAVAAGTATLTATLSDGTTKTVSITVNAAESSDTDKTIKTATTTGGTVYQLDSDGIDVGETYVIYSATGSRILYASSSGSTTDQVTAPSVSTEKDGLITLNTGFSDSTQLWTVTSNGIQSQASNKYLYLKNTSTSGIPLQYSSGNSTKVTFTASGNGYLVKMNSNSSTRYLYNTGSKFGVTDSSSSATVFYFYKKVTTAGATTYTADNSKLLELIATANALTEGDYTTASWSDLKTALTAANAIGTPVAQDTVSAAQTDQDKINTAAKNLNAAINALVKVENITVVVGNTTTVENLTGTLDTSSLDKTIATAALSNGTLTVTGVKEGSTSVKVGDKVYNITVKPSTVEASMSTTPFIVGTNSITTGAGEKLTKLSTSVGTSYDIDLGTAYASSSAEWSMDDTSIATVDSNGKVTGVAAGETTLYCKVDGVTYSMPIVVYNTGSSSASKTKICSLHTTEITNTEVWYAWNLLTGNDNMPTNMIKAVDGEAIYVAFPSGDAYCINYYGAPDDGYALTFMSATNSQGQYLAVDDKDDVTQCDWYANSGACYNERSNQTYISTSSGRLTAIQNEIKAAISTAKAYTADEISAAGLSVDGAQGFSRSTSSTDDTDCNLTFRSEKLPTVTKTIDGIMPSGKSSSADFEEYTEGMTAHVGDKVYFKVSVKQYATTEAVTYTNATLTDNLTGASFVTLSNDKTTITSDNTLTKSGMLSDSTLTADTTKDYIVEYTIQDSDLDKDIENTVDLTYNYSSTYSSGTFAGSANASAKISAPSFTPKDIVIDFGLPVTINYSGDAHGRYDLASGTASYGDVTVSDNKVTYTPNTVLKGIDTVTLTNTSGGTCSFKVYPASTVYYEEGFATDVDGFTGGSKGNSNQQTQVLGSKATDSTSTISNYGYDSSYSAVKESNGTQATGVKGASMYFKFKGTGIDIYANCTTETGYAMIKVYKGEELELIKIITADTKSTGIYGIDDAAQYNLPIASLSDLEYDEYTVKISQPTATTINIDGFKVYGTLQEDDNADSNHSAETCTSPYLKDSEDHAEFYELRNALLFNEDINEEEEYADVSLDYAGAEGSETEYPQVLGKDDGFTAVELKGDSNSLSQILVAGPKNEIYLPSGATFTFKASTNRDLQIGLKAVDQKTSCSIIGTAGTATVTLNSSTDMFYKIAKADEVEEQTITIKNTGDGVLSITKLKVCDDPNFSFVPLTNDDLEDAFIALGLIEEPVTYADATESINLVDYTGKVLATTSLTSNGVEGETADFTAAAIKAAAKKVLPSGYAFANASAIADATVVYGESGSVDIQIGKVATLRITYKKGGKVVGTAILTQVQTSSKTRYTFSVASIKGAAPAGSKTIFARGTSVKYGSTTRISVTCL